MTNSYREEAVKSYRTTKEECQKMISGVCSRCAGVLEPIETVDNSGHPTFWAGCMACSHFDSGVSQRVYDIAKKMVMDFMLRPYSFIDTDWEEGQETRNLKSQIQGATSIVRQVLKLNGSLATKHDDEIKELREAVKNDCKQEL